MTMKQVESQNRATGAKSIIKKPGEKKKYGSVTFGKCQIFEYEKHGDEIAEKVDIKDISDMRDEKTKLKDNIQEQENAQLAEIKKMREMMNKQSTVSPPPAADKFKSSSALNKDSKIEDSIGES